MGIQPVEHGYSTGRTLEDSVSIKCEMYRLAGCKPEIFSLGLFDMLC